MITVGGTEDLGKPIQKKIMLGKVVHLSMGVKKVVGRGSAVKDYQSDYRGRDRRLEEIQKEMQKKKK
ncbi:hypothetical protein ACFX1X_026660 [Malus domestica]